MAKYFSMDGYVCGEINTRSTSTGKLVTSFSINSPERRRNAYGEWETIAHFFQCQYWHRGEHDYRAEFIKDKAHLQLSGEPRYEEWEGDYGKRSQVRFNARDLFLIAPKGTAPAPKQDPEPEPQAEPEPEQATLYDDDIPF